MKKIIDSIKYLKIEDFIAPSKFFISLIPAFIFKIYNKIKKRKLFLLVEDGKSARDNGYSLYKYIRKNHKEEFCFFVIEKKAEDYRKVEPLGNIIEFKSLKHWIYYLAADYNISSQKHGNPCQAFFYVIHVTFNLFNNRVFLQHGITINKAKYIFYNNSKFKYIICGADDEYKYITNNFGYPKESVKYTGFSRFDELHDFEIKSNQILIMPTWRNWLGREMNNLGKKEKFDDTLFYKSWNSLLQNKKLLNFIEKNSLYVLFYPHINMQKYLTYFKSQSKNIKIVTKKTDIQKVLKDSALLITDYSSVNIDFGYMFKSVIYFQFDQEEYRKKQYEEGYFIYDRDGFGPVIKDSNAVVDEIIKSYNEKFQMQDKYLAKAKNFFKLHDKKNSKRIYELIKKEK